LKGFQKEGDDINVNILHEGQSRREFLGKLKTQQAGTAREKTQRLIEFLPL
jgi:hypothetical protein